MPPSTALTAMTAAILVFLTCAVNGVPNPESHVSTPSGLSIPIAKLSALLSDNTPTPDLPSRLHEITPDFTLLTHASRRNLRPLLGPRRRLHPRPVRTFVNGAESHAPFAAFERHGSGYAVATDASGAVVWLEAPGVHLAPVDLSAYPGVFLSVRHASDIIQFGPDVVPPVSPSPSPAAGSARARAAAQPAVAQLEPTCLGSRAPAQYVQLAVAIDSEMCAKHGSDAGKARAAALAMIAQAERVYAEKLCIRFVVTVFDIVCNVADDPYKSIVNPLADFRSIWPSRPAAAVPRAIAVLLTGVDYMSGVAGQAYTGVTCMQIYSYAWLDNLYSLVFVHEIGHNLNADHTDDGVMKEAINLAIDNYFSDISVSEIVAFVDSESSRSACIKTLPDPSPSAGPLTCATALSGLQSVSCVDKATWWRTRFPVSVDGLSGTATIGMQIGQQFGFSMTATGPRSLTLGSGANARTLSVQLRSMSVLASFDRASRKAVSRRRTRTVRNGRSLTGFHYPGDVDVADGRTSCCGETMYVQGVVKIRVFDADFDRTYAKLVRKPVTLRCQRFSACAAGFSPASEDTKCAVCKN